MRVSSPLLLLLPLCAAFAPARAPRRVAAAPVSMTAGNVMGPAATELLGKLRDEQEQISFALTMSTIDELFDVEEVAFRVGDVANEKGTNMGSAKILSFGKINGLEQATTLNLFGDFYRVDVLQNPDGDDHANIRAFMKGGWASVEFADGLALKEKDADFGVNMMGFSINPDCF